MAGAWWSSEEEFRFFESICVVILAAIAEFFDTLKNALQAWVMKHDHVHKQQADVAGFYVTLFTRGSSELMVLGFLAFCVWLTSRSGGFDAIVAILPSEAACGDSSSYKLRMLAAASDACRRVLAEKPAEVDTQAQYGRDPFNYPPKGSDLLHVVEDVHMQMFVAMLLYFLIMGMGITYAKHMCERWHWWEEEMHAYSRFPVDENRAGIRRMLFPLSDVKDFFKVKLYFVQWAQGGGLRHVEEKRARELARKQQLELSKLYGKVQAASASRRGSTASTVGEEEQTGSARRRESVAAADGGVEGADGKRRPKKGADVRINERFHFAEYLSFCFAELLEELIEFKPITWGFVMTLSGLEAVAMFFGARFVTMDILYTALTCAVLIFMWAVAKLFSRDVIKASEGGAVSIGRCSSSFGQISQRFHVEVHFLRVLQAIIWRNIFRVAEFFAGPTFRTYLGESGYFYANNGPLRVVIIVILLMSALLLPVIAFDWGLAMFLPPHLDDRNVEVAELVCWRQKHPLESFSAPWEAGLDNIATGDGDAGSTAGASSSVGKSASV